MSTDRKLAFPTFIVVLNASGIVAGGLAIVSGKPLMGGLLIGWGCAFIAASILVWVSPLNTREPQS